ncbi:TPA: MFS transporter, partial [Aeromonas hydrophila]
LSGDFAAAWQWQLAGLVLMSLLVLRLDPRYYPRAMRQSSSKATAPLTRDNPSA